MIINSFITYGLEKENVKKAIQDIDFKDNYFWGGFSWGLYTNEFTLKNVFILFEYNSYYGFIVRQIAYEKNGKIITKECSDGGIENDLMDAIGYKISYRICITKYDIEEWFNSEIID